MWDSSFPSRVCLGCASSEYAHAISNLNSQSSLASNLYICTALMLSAILFKNMVGVESFCLGSTYNDKLSALFTWAPYFISHWLIYLCILYPIGSQRVTSKRKSQSSPQHSAQQEPSGAQLKAGESMETVENPQLNKEIYHVAISALIWGSLLPTRVRAENMMHRIKYSSSFCCEEFNMIFRKWTVVLL